MKLRLRVVDSSSRFVYRTEGGGNGIIDELDGTSRVLFDLGGVEVQQPLCRTFMISL
jgi:hypothetical protein